MPKIVGRNKQTRPEQTYCPLPVVRPNDTAEPTADEVTQLEPGQYFAWNGYYYVQASAVDMQHLYFNCPFCKTRYKNNGQPTARSKNVLHLHGSDSLSPRREHRVGHCIRNKGSFFIYITPNTKGVSLSKLPDTLVTPPKTVE